MRDISEIRCDIDKTDEEITALFERRMALSKEVSLYKKENGLPTLNSAREQEVIEKVTGLLDNKALAPYVKALYTCLMDLSKEYQNSI